MTLKKKLLIALVVVAGAAAALYANRLLILQYSLGWHTDWKYPREPNHPVAWADGPATADKPVAQRPPNVIVILADDLGINDVTTHGGGYAAQGVPTPNIDAIARDGVRFDQGYAAAAVCTVSRAALLTGRYPWRFGVEFTPTPGAMARVAGALYADPERLYPVIIDQEKAKAAKDFNDLGMPPSEQTVAELLKARGYHTLHIGKWHLGSTPEMRPNGQGFDETLFMESGLHLPEKDPRVVNSKQDFDPIDKFLWPNMRFAVSYNAGKWFEPSKYLADYYTDEAVNAIRKNKNRPFFLYLAHWVMQTLREEGLDENTLVIFTSDNGAPGYIGLPEVNRPYRGWKLTQFEGGLRVPFVARWPGHIQAGTQYKPAVSSIDILPTVAAAAGAAVPADRPIDGVNLLPYLAKEGTAQAPRALFWRDGPMRTVQEQGWKLTVTDRPKKDWLFNLNTDPTEKNNLAATEPEKLAQLKSKLQAHHAGMPAPRWPSFIEMPIAIDKTLDQKMTPQDDYTYWYN